MTPDVEKSINDVLKETDELREKNEKSLGRFIFNNQEQETSFLKNHHLYFDALSHLKALGKQ